VEIYPAGVQVLNRKVEPAVLYILDTQLIGTDGLEICRFLKSNDRTKNRPVIILTASPNIKNLATLAGADAVLEKPFKIKDLRALVGRLVST